MRKHITVSAPGKLMLLGEHAVVYNHPCLVTAVGQRMRAKITIFDKPVFELHAPDVKVIGYKKHLNDIGIGDIPKGAKFVEIAIKNFYEQYPFKGGVKVETSSEFSALFGFGSSSASTVCIVKALSMLYNIRLDNKKLFDLAYKTVLDIQGKGSGFDVAAALYGGTLYFVTAGKVIEPLDVKSLPLIIGYSGIKADTVILMNQVSELSKDYPEIVKDLYVQIDRLVELGKTAIEKKDWQSAGELMNINQGYLESLGVSTGKLSAMIYEAREAGAYGAKLSGAGGGDCIIALSSKETKQKIITGIEKAGGKGIDVETNVEGVRIEL